MLDLEPDLFERVVTLVDAAVADRGWYSPHILIKVEDGDEPESWDLGLKDLPEGVHPADELYGFVAPSSWLAMGLVAFGWAAPIDGIRPSQHTDRVRVRTTILIERNGQVHSTTAMADGTVFDSDGEDGLIPDVLRLCLGLPTPPPPPIDHLADVMWLGNLVRVAAQGHTLTATEALAMRLPPEGGASAWSKVRRIAAQTGRWPYADTWMDDGFFARQFLSALPTVDESLVFLEEFLRPSVIEAIRSTLTEV